LLVSHRTPRITIVERTIAGFEVRDVRSGESVRLASPRLELAADDVYRGIALDAE
jgi:hypothetical protein